MIATAVFQEVNILNGTYTPSEAWQIISGVIDQQINFYKLQHLSKWERDHMISKDYVDQRIVELNNKKQEIKEVIKQARQDQQKVKLGGCIELVCE